MVLMLQIRHGPACSVMEISYQTFPSHGISVTLPWWLRTKDFVFSSPFCLSVLLCLATSTEIPLPGKKAEMIYESLCMIYPFAM